MQRDGQAIRQGIGVALQEAGLDDYQTGRELLRLQSRLCNVPSAEIEGRITHLLGVIDLEDAADRRVGTYSGGMRRRLDLVAALVHQPRIVFLDEPTTGLDPISRDNVWRYVERLNKEEGVTFFLTTQYLEEADRLADEVAILDLGRIVAQGSPTELKSTLASDVVTVEIEGEEAQAQQGLAALRGLDGLDDVRASGQQISVYSQNGGGTVSQVVRVLDEAGLAFGDVRLSHPTLDDVFLRATGHHMEPAAEPEEEDGQA